MPCTEAYREHIMYTFNSYCKTVIRFAAINAWRDRSRRRQKEISLEYLTDDLFHYSAGQQCTIYKAAAFTTGDEIIYIPDISLNDIPMDRPLRNGEEIEEVLSVCYAGVDFVQECAGDVKLAEQLFYYCDWQHPSSALPEVDYEDEVI